MQNAVAAERWPLSVGRTDAAAASAKNTRSEPHVTSLTINRLTRVEVEGLIDRVAGNKPLACSLPVTRFTSAAISFAQERASPVIPSPIHGGLSSGRKVISS